MEHDHQSPAMDIDKVTPDYDPWTGLEPHSIMSLFQYFTILQMSQFPNFSGIICNSLIPNDLLKDTGYLDFTEGLTRLFRAL
jgi:hypothetical protein